MFTIKADYSDNIEFKTSLEQVRAFFADIRNFAELMPGVSGIEVDSNGVAHWKIVAELPLVGKMDQDFSVELTENSDERIEWFPLGNESRNFLRFSADFLEKAKNVTMVHFSQMVELRRRSARDLHMLAGMAGETIISAEMGKRVTEMIKTFIHRAKEKLEN